MEQEERTRERDTREVSREAFYNATVKSVTVALTEARLFEGCELDYEARKLAAAITANVFDGDKFSW